mgnify:CR=1 FL=1
MRRTGARGDGGAENARPSLPRGQANLFRVCGATTSPSTLTRGGVHRTRGVGGSSLDRYLLATDAQGLRKIFGGLLDGSFSKRKKQGFDPFRNKKIEADVPDVDVDHDTLRANSWQIDDAVSLLCAALGVNREIASSHLEPIFSRDDMGLSLARISDTATSALAGKSDLEEIGRASCRERV